MEPRTDSIGRPAGTSTTVVRTALAISLAIGCVKVLGDTATAAHTFGPAALMDADPATRVVAVAACVTLALAILAVIPATRRAAGWCLAAVLVLAASGLVVAWADGRPAACLCLARASQGGVVAHVTILAFVLVSAAAFGVASALDRH